VGLSFAGKSIDISRILKGQPTGKLVTVEVPLRCFADLGATVNAVTTPLKLEADKGTDFVMRSATIEPVGEAHACS
jgi:beta-glucosidase